MSAGVDPFNKEVYPGTGEALGEFRIVRELGRGGCGVVFEALQARLDRPVALKVVPVGEGGAYAGVGERFKREVDLIKRLEHPNIVRLYDYGEVGDDLLWMAMELVNGPELQSVMKTQGRLGPERSRRIVLQLLSALAEAHEIEVIHRDLKPSNIMLTRKGADHDVVKVVDFGIGKAIGKAEDKDLQELTGEHGDLLGTPRYMAPEVLKGDTIGPFSDVYAVGLILFEMLTDRPAVTGSTVYEVCAQQIYHDIRMPSWLEQTPFGELIRKATEKNTWDRFETALDFHEALRNIELSDEEFNRLLKESDEPLTSGFPKLETRKARDKARRDKAKRKSPPRFNFPTSKTAGSDLPESDEQESADGMAASTPGIETGLLSESGQRHLDAGSSTDGSDANAGADSASADADSGSAHASARAETEEAAEENSDPLVSGNVELNKLDTGPVPEVESDEIAVEPSNSELAGGDLAFGTPARQRPSWFVPALIAGAMIAALLLILLIVSSSDEESSADAAASGGEAGPLETDDETSGEGEDGETGESAGAGEIERTPDDEGSPGEGEASAREIEPGTDGAGMTADGTGEGDGSDFEFIDEQVEATPSTVEWAFNSRPEGAQVKADGKVICEDTPCTVALEVSEEEVEIWFYKRGYRGAKTTVTPNQSGEHNQKLRRRQRDNSGGDDDNDDPFNVRSFD